MKQEAADLLAKALKLPTDARAALAGSLLDSLDDTVDEDAESSWEAEISRRLDEVRSGKTVPISWAEARRRIMGE
jgi:putative addiction module component (TIGR02574 family)